MSGELLRTSGRERRTLLYSWTIVMAIVAVVNSINVITILHESGKSDLYEPIVLEGSSWLTFTLFFGVIWAGWRWAPPNVRPRRRLALHLLLAPLFSLLHVYGFLLIRQVFIRDYQWDAFLPQYTYELSKDVGGYLLFYGCCALVDHLLPRERLPALAETFDIRDGASLIRVRLEEVLAVTAAGNYVEFVLRDQRRLLMRSTLAAVEDELAPRGFLRTHRSWLVNSGQVTALHPEGSGDYRIEMPQLSVPLSRRFPAALAELRDG